jgi:hypothetical protein
MVCQFECGKQVSNNATTCPIQVDIGVDIDGLVHDAFIIVDMLKMDKGGVGR